jgi:Copper binding proteins, plastocyanin/azurin family
MLRRRGIVALLAVAIAAASVMALGGVGAARSTKPKVVYVCDDYYGAHKTCDGQQAGTVKIPKRGKVKWQWTPVFNNHNVKLTKAPRGVTKSQFRSQTSSSPDYSFTKRFKKPGRYHFICTIHPVQMQMDVRVRRPS